MPTYERFIFDSYELKPDARTIELRYSLDDQVHFTETFTLPDGLDLTVHHPNLEPALFALHLSGGASYYKTSCPKTIEVRSGRLTKTQAAFWNKLYTHGLGQFFYENKLDFHGLINFPVTAESAYEPGPGKASGKGALVPFGGGKDSIVTTEILRAAGETQTLFRLRGHHIITELAGIAELPVVEVGRTLAPELFELNKAGAYNGHIPITAHISFLTVVIGLLGGYDSVYFSSERSSSYGNVDYLGMEVNHQWSKSLDAERMLRDYISTFVTKSVKYENALRPLSELHIAKIFTQHAEYFHAATSCNRNWVLSERSADAPRWCGECPKCAFSFALFAAYLPAETVSEMFSHNLFEDENLLPLYRELWGVVGFKPFECVGTPEEAGAACYLAQKQSGYTGTPVMDEFVKTVLPGIKDPEQLLKQLYTPELSASPTETTTLLNKAHVL
ncbi:MAG TPA: endonuclease domain-containing protein [Candidatus Saccharimonadia bacterium]|jgi:hypothetical protein|nr:endonuclease domain-containing protein [Candidatus Saccharimonadia bacterium]